jgi:hypothetical protein
MLSQANNVKVTSVIFISGSSGDSRAAASNRHRAGAFKG